MVDATNFLKTNSAEPGKLSAVQGKTKGKIKHIKMEPNKKVARQSAWFGNF
jgi:hypothetical protein